MLLVVITAVYLLVLPAPKTGPLAVLWWAAVIAVVILAAFYTVRGRFAARGGNGPSADSIRDANPSQMVLWVSFLVLMALVSAVLFAVHLIPGT